MSIQKYLPRKNYYVNQKTRKLLFKIVKQYCDQELVPLCAEHRYQPIKIAYLLSHLILIGASSEISDAENHLFSQLFAGLCNFSRNFKFIGFCRLSRIQYIYCFRNILNKKNYCSFSPRNLISYLVN